MTHIRTLTVALAAGDLETARACCQHAVRFLEMALSGVPAHPMLALQRFTLADLESACGDATAALHAMEAWAAALELTAATHSTLRAQASERVVELRSQAGARAV